MSQASDVRRISVMVDYLFGRGVSRALPKKGFRLFFSRRSGRVKLIQHEGKIFATVKPNGAFALSVYGAQMLAKSARFGRNCVQVSDGVVDFVKGGKSVFCKFVEKAGENVHPKSEVAITDGGGRVIGVGTAVLNGNVMRQLTSGVAVKDR